MAVSRDTIVAILLLVFCAVMWNASYDIEVTTYGTLQSSVWPRIVIVALGAFSAFLLLTSLLRRPADATPDQPAVPLARRFRNATLIYVLFLLFLLTLPTLGMLLGGVLFVFFALTALGRPSLRLVPMHAAISVASIGAMWAIFTFGLRVILPRGEILPI